MKKIPTIYRRDPSNMSRVLPEPHPDCAWVFAGEGVATRKYDGTCCLVRDGRLFKRRELKAGTPEPAGFEVADRDDMTGKTVGWVPVDFGAPEDKHHAEAFKPGLPDGTYELLGPKVQGNPEKFAELTLVAHANAEVLADTPRNFDALREWMAGRDIEGVVWHHPDGRMAKLKLRDFGLRRGSTES